MTKDVMITTSDNPFDPFKQFSDWYNFDTDKGYNTCAYLARVVRTSEDISEEDERVATEAAIDEILELNLTGNYVKVYRDSE